MDAALVEVTDADWEPPQSWAEGGAGQRFGELVTTVAGHRVTARGFPRFQRDARGRLDEQVDGRISPGTGSIVGRYEVISDDPLPAPADDGRSEWAGMSGAALFSGALLIGVIRSDRGARHGARLLATRIRDVLDVPAVASLVCAQCSNVPIVEPAELADVLDPAPALQDLRSPAMLLRADAEVVRFRGRERERDILLGWLLSGRGDMPVRVLTGPGGQGKTRLARWLVGAAREQGCSAGLLASGLGDEPDGVSADLGVFARVNSPVLIVVDYAESRPGLVRRLIEVSRQGGRRVRVLLLARAIGPWKTELLGSSAAVHEILASAPEMELGPLDVTAAERGASFAATVRDMAGILGQVQGHEGVDWPELAGKVSQPGELGADQYRSALSLQMTALARLLQSGPSKVRAGEGEPVEAVLLRHEQRYWERTAWAHHLGELGGVILRRMVAAACLCGAASEEQAARTLIRLQYLPPDKMLAAGLWLQQLYPAPGGRFWGSLQPDRVAEFQASAVATETTGLLARLLTGAEPGQQIQAITVLTRAVIAHANGNRREAGKETLSQLTSTLAEIRADPEVLQACVTALPRYSVMLTSFGVKLAEDLVMQYRQLAAARPDFWELQLATSLYNLSIRYADAERPEQSLAAAEEAVAIGRRLAAVKPSYMADLGIALANLAIRYANKGDTHTGTASADEAVAAYRQLAAADRETHEPGLAMALHNLSLIYGKARQTVKALDTIEEGVAIRRRLTAADPDVHEPSLTESLINLSVQSQQARMPDQALTAMLEAVTILRQLATANPDGYEPRLAWALDVLSSRYDDAARPAEALTAIGEAVAIRQRLAAANPDVYDAYLAASQAKIVSLSQPAAMYSPSDALKHGIGVNVPIHASFNRRNHIILPKGTPAPCQAEIILETIKDGQHSFMLQINGGDYDDLDFVSTMALSECPLARGTPAGHQLRISVTVSRDQVIQVQAWDHTSDALISELEFEPPAWMTEDLEEAEASPLSRQTTTVDRPAHLVNYYTLLGIDQDAAPEQIEDAVRARRRQWLYRANSGSADAQRIAKWQVAAIQAAWETLCDPALRATHDREIAAGELPAAEENPTQSPGDMIYVPPKRRIWPKLRHSPRNR